MRQPLVSKYYSPFAFTYTATPGAVFAVKLPKNLASGGQAELASSLPLVASVASVL